ncbi:MAG: type VI secretion protein [Bacteroidetes bacterium]|nr:MAG: type VI secretion protein [Bacteroidota bacterium]
MAKKVAFVGSKMSNGATIIGPGIPTVRVNGHPISVLGDKVSDGHTITQIIGNQTVRAGGKLIARFGDKDSKGHTIATNVSPNISI